MPINTDLNIFPYGDDYNERKDFYKILFQPGVSVQVRELNQLQTMLQKQVERFGDNIFVRGTILSGCNFIFLNPYPYIKINDNLADGVTAAIPSTYVGKNIRSTTSGLAGYIMNYADGFEAQDPDLKTLFVKYTNGGDNSNTFAFSAGEALEVFDYTRTIRSVKINNGGSGFSNNDQIVISPALVVNNNGTFTAGDYLNDGASANVEIVSVDSVSLANQGQVILSVKPLDSQLTNSSITSTAWSFANGTSVENDAASANGVIVRVIGAGLQGYVVTDGIGAVANVVITNHGSNYTTIPQVTVKTSNTSASVGTLDLEARNYYANVVVSTVSASVGNGYAFGITDGVIYQKGYFLRANNQTVIVSKYSQTPDQIAIGFDTTEEIINSDQDTSLLDNATGQPNELAPGADRLKLTPILVAVNASAANTDSEFFTLVEFSEGRPYLQNRNTRYNVINDEMARRTADESGDYVVDPFLISTASPANNELESFVYSLKVDPGTAYVGGYRVSTRDVYTNNVNRSVSTRTDLHNLSLNYGNYITVKEVGGLFQFSTGDQVALYDTAKQFISNTDNVILANTNPAGTQIGTARIRSMVPLNNIVPENPLGTANSQYRLYLFDIQMNAGKTFKDIRAMYYDGASYKGICDVLTTLDGTSNTYIAQLGDVGKNKLLFYSGVDSLKNANGISYTYRTVNQTQTFSNNGVLVYSIAATPNEFFITTGAMSNSQLQSLYVVPIGGDMIAADNRSGTFNVLSTTDVIEANTGTDIQNEFVVGDYVALYANSTGGYDIRQITQIINATAIQVTSNATFSNGVSVIRRAFPNSVPIPFGKREGLSGSIDANGNVMTLSLFYEDGVTQLDIGKSTSTNTAVGVDIIRQSADRKTKSPQRNRFVKIRLANNTGVTSGPWSLGVPDVFRLRNVYVANTVDVNVNSTNAKAQFYVDHNQNPNYLGLSYLYALPRNNLNLTTDDYLLVEFDYFTESGSGGFADAISYVSSNTEQRQTTDSQPLSNLTTTVSSFEIPQVVSDKGVTYDLISYFDFRPSVEATATPNTTATNAPVNPTETISFGNTADPANDKKFPLPDSIMSSTIEQYMGRIDSVFLNKHGRFSVVPGTPASGGNKVSEPRGPENEFRVLNIYVPPYPNMPFEKSTQFYEILNTQVINIKFPDNRFENRTIKSLGKPTYRNGSLFLQPRAYRMQDIAKLERRIQDLEYYVNLNMLETNIKDRVILSSVDPNMNRFKYGFFVDPFDSPLFSDRTNPVFAATIEDDDAIPEKMTWATYFDTPHNGAYIDNLLVNQINSSDPADADPPDCLPDTQIANSLQYAANFEIGKTGNTTGTYVNVKQIQFAAGASVLEDGTVAFTNSSATLYFYNYDKDVKIEIYQGDTLLANTGAAQALTSSEKTFVTSMEASKWFDDQYSTFGQDYSLNGNYAKYMGKITFTHNPSLGRNYTIKTIKGTDSFRWKWLLEYPIDRSTVGCPPPEDTTPNTEPMEFIGVMTRIVPEIVSESIDNGDHTGDDAGPGGGPGAGDF